MSRISDLLERDWRFIVASGDMNETVTYTPKDGSGPFEFEAVVFREEPRNDRPETNRARFHQAQVAIPFSSDTNIGLETVDTLGDHIDVVLRPGQPATTCRVVEVLTVDEGLWLLEVAK